MSILDMGHTQVLLLLGLLLTQDFHADTHLFDLIKASAPATLSLQHGNSDGSRASGTETFQVSESASAVSPDWIEQSFSEDTKEEAFLISQESWKQSSSAVTQQQPLSRAYNPEQDRPCISRFALETPLQISEQ